jgi:hypothetical protein
MKNQGMQNEKVVTFANEIKEVEGLEANSSLQTKCSRISRVNEENIQIKRGEKKKQIL